MSGAILVVVPQMMLVGFTPLPPVPQTMLNALAPDVPHTMLLLQLVPVPHTIFVPFNCVVPQTMFAPKVPDHCSADPAAKLNVPVFVNALYPAVGDSAFPVGVSLLFSAA